MKHLEELSRQHVEEAIQAGLRSQSAHRARFEHKQPPHPASPQKVARPDPQVSSRLPWFFSIFSIIKKFAR